MVGIGETLGTASEISSRPVSSICLLTKRNEQNECKLAQHSIAVKAVQSKSDQKYRVTSFLDKMS